jgi:hypothetical protein
MNASSLFNVYWNRFGCLPYDFVGDREENGKKAGQCAIERMAEIKNRILKNLPIDASHLQPIKLAYEMGKVCLKDTLKYNTFIAQFRTHYEDLIKDRPDVHNLFQTHYGIDAYPLNIEQTNIKTRINSKITPSIQLYVKSSTNKTYKNTNKSKNTAKKNKKNVLTLV